MNKKKVLLATLLVLLGFGGVASAYVHATVAQYQTAAPCGKLQGIPGLLQAAKLIPQSDCVYDSKKGRCHDDHACTFADPNSPTAPAIKGNCRTVAATCVCVANPD